MIRVRTTAPSTSSSLPSRRRRVLAAVGVFCVALAVTSGAAGIGAYAADQLVLDRQHTDAVSVRYENGALALKTRADLDSGAGQILNPAEVLFHVTDGLKGAVPDLPAYSFLGAPETPIWTIPQSQVPGQLWAGWETESIPTGLFAGDTVRLDLQSISGPGDVEIYLNDTEGPRRLVSSRDSSLRTITENVRAHVHANWVFTAPGEYVLTFVAHADLVGAGTISSAPQSYRFLVGSGAQNPDPQPSTPDPQPSDPTPTPTTPDPTPTHPGPSPTGPAEPSPSPTTPAPVDPSIAPSQPLSAPDPAALTDGSRGEVRLASSSAAPGSQVSVTVPTSYASQWLSAWLLSTPTDLGWKQVSSTGGFTVTVPAVAALEPHRLVIRDRSGGLVGWTELTAVAPEAAIEECIATPVTTTSRPENVDIATAGHFDFGPVKEGGTWRALLKDDRSSPARWKDPGTIVFHLSDAAAGPSPQSFLGSGRVWEIPLTQRAGVPWLGWNTQHSTVAGKASGPVALTLNKLEGPGQLAVYSVNSFGQASTQYFGTVGGFPRSTSIEVGAAGVHVHGIWAFTQPGAYYADLSFTGTIGGERVDATSTVTFFVGEGDPRSAVRERTVTTYVGRTASGAECQLALAASGPADAEATADLGGLAGTLLVVGLAFLGASALAPRGAGSTRARKTT